MVNGELFFHIAAFVVEVLGGEEGELDLVGGFLDGNASDVGVQSAVAIDADVGWLFALYVDSDALWCDILMVKRHSCYAHKSPCIAIQFHDRSAIAMSVGCGADGRAEYEACAFDGVGFAFGLDMKGEIVDEVFADDDVIDSIGAVCVAIAIVHGDMGEIFGDDGVVLEWCREFAIVSDMVHEEAEGSEIDADEGQVVGLVFFDTIEHEAIAASDEDSVGFFGVIGKVFRVLGDIVLECGGIFVGAEEGEEYDGGGWVVNYELF